MLILTITAAAFVAMSFLLSSLLYVQKYEDRAFMPPLFFLVAVIDITAILMCLYAGAYLLICLLYIKYVSHVVYLFRNS